MPRFIFWPFKLFYWYLLKKKGYHEWSTSGKVANNNISTCYWTVFLVRWWNHPHRKTIFLHLQTTSCIKIKNMNGLRKVPRGTATISFFLLLFLFKYQSSLKYVDGIYPVKVEVEQAPLTGFVNFPSHPEGTLHCPAYWGRPQDLSRASACSALFSTHRLAFSIAFWFSIKVGIYWWKITFPSLPSS